MSSRISAGCLSVLLLLTIAGCVRRTPVVSPQGPTVAPQTPKVVVSVPPVTPSPRVVQATLTASGSRPFHLRAVITERGDPTSKTDVEISWVAPDKWRRTIQSQTEFSQTLIVNGDQVFEHDSDDYFPLWSRTLVTAMVDPKQVLDAYTPGDILVTKANGSADESGRVCSPPPSKICMIGRYGLSESVGAAGRDVHFTDYRKFHEVRVARLLTYNVDPGDSYRAQVTELTDLEDPDQDLFSIPQPTPIDRQIRSIVLPEVDLRKLALQPLEIVWPQVLDGATSGTTSYYVSVDRLGKVAEVLPLSVAAERADGSARRQVMKWKFKPFLQDGAPVQTEGVLTFDFNTRAYGPPEPLNDTEARKLASTIIEPVIPPGVAPGSTFTFSLAVDETGDVIEIIAGDGPHELSRPCFEAIKKWRFNPLIQEGKPLPYRAQVVFRMP
jgi:Gram-negative bacterial TonB protein C-terminal